MTWLHHASIVLTLGCLAVPVLGSVWATVYALWKERHEPRIMEP